MKSENNHYLTLQTIIFSFFIRNIASQSKLSGGHHMTIDKQLNLEIMQFVETNILPQYTQFGRSHGLAHVKRVVEHSLQLAHTTGADINMAYVVAAYHDIGMSGHRAIHHITGRKILEADQRLRKWFTEQQISIMGEAVEDHRASSSHAPRSIYGKIVAEADRELEPDIVFLRTVLFGLENYPEKSREEQWERFLEHMDNKYSRNGYITLWIPNSPNHKHLQEIRRLLADKEELRRRFDQIYDEERKAVP